MLTLKVVVQTQYTELSLQGRFFYKLMNLQKIAESYCISWVRPQDRK